MKGVILAGGTGSRLEPLTRVTNKHLLPIYNKPMVFYPLHSMQEAGITEVMIISGKGHCGDFLELIGSGSSMGMRISYEIQEKPGGIAQALALAENFADGDNVAVILGDNVIEDDISEAVEAFDGKQSGGRVFLKEVDKPESYGVAEVSDGKIVSIVEKPSNPKSNLAVIGCYFYTNDVFDVVRTLKPSDRGELEITDVNNHYLSKGALDYSVLDGFWGDCGESFDSLFEVTKIVRDSKLADIKLNIN